MTPTPEQNAVIFERALAEVRASGRFTISPFDEGPPDDDEDGFWEAVEARCVELGGAAPGPAGS
jgi:hypothetical protein